MENEIKKIKHELLEREAEIHVLKIMIFELREKIDKITEKEFNSEFNRVVNLCLNELEK